MAKTLPGRVAQIPPPEPRGLTAMERQVLDTAIAYVEAYFAWNEMTGALDVDRKRLHKAQRALILAVENLKHEPGT